ncbi:MAG: 3'-5' exonuclease [Tannerella sp.]|jgi:DNA polymerase-3 subunit epsilon|nr:3'-5' exonuclease [Tannerella sp.]
MKQMFFDLETTGFDPEKNCIHQLSGIIVIDGKNECRFNFYVRPFPGAVIDPGALAVSGVTAEQIMSYPPPEEACMELVEMLDWYADKDNDKDRFFLVGYNNVSFDDRFFREFFRQNGGWDFKSRFWHNSIDVMVLASDYLAERRTEMDNFKLPTVARFLGIDVDDASLHNSVYDIFLTKAIYDIVKSRQNE